MTKKLKEIVDQAIIDLRKLQCCGDVESAHGDADDVLCRVLKAFGLQEGEEITCMFLKLLNLSTIPLKK